MIKGVILDRKKNGAYEGTFETLISAIPAVRAKELVWTIVDFDAVGTPLDGRTMPELVEAAESPRGLRIEWDELLAFAGGLDSVFQVCAIGAQSPISNQRATENPFRDRSLTSQATIMLGRFDAGPWTVVADEAILAEVKVKINGRNMEWECLPLKK